MVTFTECAGCGLDADEIDDLDFWEQNIQFFDGKYYCHNCIQDAVIDKMTKFFNSREYKEILKIVKIVENLDFFEYNKDSISFVLASFVILNNLGRDAHIFFNTHKREVFESLIEITLEYIKEKLDIIDKVEDLISLVEVEDIQLISENRQYKIITIFISSIINKKITEGVTNEDIQFLKNNALLNSFERRIREFLDDHLKKEYGENFFDEKKGIPTELIDDLNKNISYTKMKEPWRTNLSPFEECTINNYKSIILYNWDQIFKNVFVSKENLRKHFENINYWRNCLYHNKKMDKSIRLNGLGSIDWFKNILGFG